MKFEQARTLFELINTGHAVGATPDGDIVTASTQLGTALSVLGVRSYLSRIGSKAPGLFTWDTVQAVTFLRDWADGLESQEPLK